MAFEIIENTRAKLASVTARVEKHGDDEKPAVTLSIAIEAANTMLDLLDRTLRPTLYKAAADGAQADIPDVEQVLPVLRCNAIDRVLLPTKHEGWTLNVDTDIDENRPMSFGGCKLDGFSVEPKQGGSILLRFKVGTSDIDAERSGMLMMQNGEPIWITLLAPKVAPPAIDGTGAEFKREHPDAGDLFAERHGDAGEGEDEPPFDPDDEEEAEQAEDAGNEEPPVATSTRTARGRAATKKSLAEGMKAAGNAATAKAKRAKRKGDES